MAQHKLEQYKIDLNTYRLDIAIEDLTAAQRLASENSFRIANNRAYYAIFHAFTAVQALDETMNLISIAEELINLIKDYSEHRINNGTPN